MIGYFRLLAIRTRAPVLVVALLIFAAVGTYFYPNNPVGSSFASTSVLAVAAGAWLLLAILTAEPPAQADMATAAAGGLARRSRGVIGLAVLAAIAMGASLVAYPVVLGLFQEEPVFTRRLRLGDVAAALASNALGALVGGAIGVLCAPPRVGRRANSAAAAIAMMLALVALSGPLGHLAGPIAAADALSSAPAGTITGRELLTWAASLALTALLLTASAVLDRWRA